jgi:hypothetical protein
VPGSKQGQGSGADGRFTLEDVFAGRVRLDDLLGKGQQSGQKPGQLSGQQPQQGQPVVPQQPLQQQASQPQPLQQPQQPSQPSSQPLQQQPQVSMNEPAATGSETRLSPQEKPIDAYPTPSAPDASSDRSPASKDDNGLR